MLKKLLVLVFSFLFLSSASALVITNNPGGYIGEFITQYRKVARNHENVTITRSCRSACTLVLSYVPRNKICAYPGASFGFHSARRAKDNVYAYEGTKWMWDSFPTDVKTAIWRHGWDGVSEHPQIVVVPANELVKTCRSPR